MTDGWRLVINLSTLNSFVMVMKFQMETMVSVLWSIRKGDWMFSIYLKDAYFPIPVHPESLPFPRFCLEGLVYQFHALCVGLSTNPQVFTRVIALVSEWAHWRDVHQISYLDNWLVIAGSRDLLWHWEVGLQLCKGLRIVVNQESLTSSRPLVSSIWGC